MKTKSIDQINRKIDDGEAKIYTAEEFKKLVKNDVIMEDNTTLPVSRSNVKPLKDALYSYVEGSAF